MSKIASLHQTSAAVAVDHTNEHEWPTFVGEQTMEEKDHFIHRNGLEFAGTHLLIDFWGASGLTDLELMESKFRECVEACGATLLHIHLHHFTPNGGISGVAVLAESHISVHTWPERGYAAFDIFMCGDAQPEKALPILREAFQPTRVTLSEELRGQTRSEESTGQD
ncbi:MAG: adenosylmethionine decarboxylase [Pseudomonadota bacterium]